MWTMENTEGFTQAQLDIINEVLRDLLADGIEPSNANDMINNAWNDSIKTADDLRKALRR